MPRTTESRLRIEKSGRLLRAAEELLGGGHFDASIGCASYGVYHAIVALLVARGVAADERGRWSHGRAQTRFRRLPGAEPYARLLTRLYQARLVAHYTLHPVSRDEGASSMRDALSLAQFADRSIDAS